MHPKGKSKSFRPKRFSTLCFTREQVERVDQNNLTISGLRLDNQLTQLSVEIIESFVIEGFESIIGLTEFDDIKYKATVHLSEKVNNIFLEENKSWSEIYG